MRYFPAALIYALLVFVLGMTKLPELDKFFLVVVALWLMRRITRREPSYGRDIFERMSDAIRKHFP